MCNMDKRLKWTLWLWKQKYFQKNIKTQTGGRVIRIGEEVQLVAKSQDINLLKPKLSDDIIHEENCECHLQN